MNTSQELISGIVATVIGGLILAIILSGTDHLKALFSNLKLSTMISLSLLSNEIKTILLSESFVSVFNPVSKIVMRWTVRFSYVICGMVIILGCLLGENLFFTVLLGGSIVVAVEVPYRML
ncbi:putative membrane protein [Sphingobacterium sp. BIGb0116]|nr:putative membrane protein [Sphingobacterium sp. BIGb0116]